MDGLFTPQNLAILMIITGLVIRGILYGAQKMQQARAGFSADVWAEMFPKD